MIRGLEVRLSMSTEVRHLRWHWLAPTVAASLASILGKHVAEIWMGMENLEAGQAWPFLPGPCTFIWCGPNLAIQVGKGSYLT
jgi:hypothetical protein